MAGYTRQSTFADGDTITAALFNNEYNQLLNAFNSLTGHKHDGTTGEGAVIALIGDTGVATPLNKVLIDTTNDHIEFWIDVSSTSVQQLYIADGAIIPVTDSDIDLGTTSLRFKDTYTDTVTTTGNVSIGGDLTVTGSATISGNLTFGDADTDSINLAAEIDSDIIPNTDGTYDLGSATKEWQDLYIDGTANIDSLVADTADINGGTIDGATIATSDITVGAGKTLNVSAGTLTLADNQISGDKVEGGTIAATTITDLTFGSLNDGTITVTAFADEDDMSSNSATLVPTQQSVKAYVDAQVTAQDLDITTDSGTIAIDLDSETLTIQGTSNEIETSASGNALTIGLPNDVTIGNNLTVTGDLTVSGDDITMGTNTDTAIMVADGTNFNPVVPSGDVTLTNAGVFGIASGVIVNADINSSAAIADSKLATISTADKVSGAAIQVDGATDGTAITIADSDKFLIDDGGTTKYVNASQINAYTSAAVALDDISTGDAAATLATSAGDITNDAQGSDTDIILKGTDGGVDTTFLTIDGSAAGAASFNSDVTVGALFKMPDVTSAKILVADGTSYQEVAVSGDVSIASSGAVTIAASAVENSMLAGSIADSKLNTISTAGKVDLSALEIDGGTDIGADLTTSDLIIVDDGAGGTNRKAALSRVVTLMTNQGFTTDDPTALAIALG